LAFAFLRVFLPLLSIVLFIGCCCVAVMRFVRQTPEMERHPADMHMALCAGGICFAVCAFCVALFAAFGFRQGTDGTLENAIRNMAAVGSTDIRDYIQLAQYGYGNGEAFPEQYLMIVFYPLFPWLVRGIHFLTGSTGCYYTIGIFVQPFLAGIGGALFYTLVQRRFGKPTAGWALAFAVALPGSFFYALPMTESLCLLLVAAAFLALEEEKPLWFAVIGYFAALTRSIGFLLAGVAGILWLQKLRAGNGFRKSFCWLAACAGPTAGFLSYLGLNWYYYGDPFAFSFYDKEHWGQELGFFFQTISHQMKAFGEWCSWGQPEYAIFVSGADIVCILFALGMLALGCKKLPLPWLGYSLAYIAVTYGMTRLLSAPRYMLLLLFVPLCIAASLRRSWQKWICLGLEICLSGLYLWQYLLGRPIC
jgi:hypothetical protein